MNLSAYGRLCRLASEAPGETMRRLSLLVAVIGMLVFFSPVARSEVYMDYDFAEGIVWQVGGFEVYDVIIRGEVVGEARVDYSQLTMLDQPAIRLEWSETWVNGDETNEILIDTKMIVSDLRAVLVSRTERIDDDEWVYDGNYSGNDLAIGYYLPGESERQEYRINRSGRILDEGVLPFLLRNIPFDDGNFATLTVLDPTTQSFFTPIVIVSASEIVETSATQYDCWAVNVSTPSGGFTAWYSKTDQHYLVKIRYSDREIVLNYHS